jgi:predicted DCC family thiol-disulfide oxidoreductase YuxK
MSATIEQNVTTKAVVLYDGECPFCQRSVAILRKLDTRHKLDIRDCRNPDNIPEAAAHVPPKRFLEEMHVVTPSGGIHSGFKAFRWMAGRMPLTMVLWPFLFIPGVPWIGQKVYLWVAKNRYKLVPCDDTGECKVPQKAPAKQ